MNIYAQEILNRFGQTMLTNMLKEFPKGFHIVGCNRFEVVVGDKMKNVTFSRKTEKIKDRVVFQKCSSKVTRKGTHK